MEPREAAAFQSMAAELGNLTSRQQVTVTGPLKQAETGYRLEVRVFTI